MRLFVTRLILSNFRNFSRLVLTPDSKSVILLGPNAIGKTNLLEAVSLLIPGRGLRGASLQDFGRNGEKLWAISATIHSDNPQQAAPILVGTGVTRSDQTRRSFFLEGGEGKRSRNKVWEKSLKILWVTPSMDGLFVGPSIGRRRLLDQFVATMDPEHRARVQRFEKLTQARKRLLEERSEATVWLTSLETQMAECGVALAAARLELVACLMRLGNETKQKDDLFPRVHLALAGNLEQALHETSAVEVEENYRNQLRESRSRDRLLKGTQFGPHRSDLSVRHATKGILAAKSSTGEQKALLLSLILAQLRLVKQLSGCAPLLLLDEIGAHLDAERRAALFEEISGLGIQCWMSGTDINHFESFGKRATRIFVQEACQEVC